MAQIQYIIHFQLEWRGGCLWPGDEFTRERLDVGPYDLHTPCPLPLSEKIIKCCHDLSAWHDESLNWEYPPDPGPWRQDECNRFNAAADQLLDSIRSELSDQYTIIDKCVRPKEDPDLDRYLEDPAGFNR